MSGFLGRLRREFQDREYRHAYVDDFLNASIATQIKALRERIGVTQIKLAELARMKQSRISALENVNYSSWSINTLRRLARVFDVALVVRFESFGERMKGIDGFDPIALAVPSFKEDPFLNQGQRKRRAQARVSVKDRIAPPSLSLVAMGDPSPKEPLASVSDVNEPDAA